MDASLIWNGDWEARLLSRVQSMGSRSILDFLDRFPAEPYIKVARRLGEDVAAVQLARMQFEEASGPAAFRRAAIDGLAREIAEHLKRGWGVGRHADFNTAGVHTGWMTLLRFRASAPPEIVRKGDAVWEELNRLDPSRGWLPNGPDDAILAAAFAAAEAGDLEGVLVAPAGEADDQDLDSGPSRSASLNAWARAWLVSRAGRMPSRFGP